ncbi:MAG: DNRLRE domain-containing protein [Actinomycetota bacterium]
MMRRPLLRHPRRQRLWLLLASIALVPLVRADAASLAVATQRLTSHRAASQVPPTTCSLAPAADTYVSEDANASNYGTSTSLLVRSAAGANRRAVLRFDLSSCSIPSNASIRTAALRLTLTSPPTVSRTYEVHRASAAWTEDTVTWSTQPSVAAPATSSAVTGMTAGAIVEWSVKADVEAFVQGMVTNEGWRISDATESESTALESGFAAREEATSSSRPILTVTYYP